MNYTIKILLISCLILVIAAAAVTGVKLYQISKAEPAGAESVQDISITPIDFSDITLHETEVETTESATETTTKKAIPEAVTSPTKQLVPSAYKSYTYSSVDADLINSKADELRSSEEKLFARISSICEKHSVVGLSLVVFKDEQELFSQVYGYADKDVLLPIEADTKFRVASMSKFATGILVMKLVDEGRLDLDSDISDCVGVQIRSPYFKDDVITPRMIMNHSSSIVDGDWAFVDGVPIEKLFGEGQEQYFSKNKPGSRYIYSNFAASLLTSVIERASKSHFVNFSQHELMKPLGIDAAYAINQLSDKNLVADMYLGGTLNKSQKKRSATSYGCLNAPIGEYLQLSFGNLMISPRDMAKLAMILSGDGSYGGVSFLSSDIVEQMNSTVPGSGSPWGLMQKIVKDALVPGRTLHGHNGEAYGYLGCIYYDRADRTGFVYMSNGSSHAGGSHTYGLTEAVAQAVYGEYFDKLS